MKRAKQPSILIWLLSAAVGVSSVALMFSWGEQEKPREAATESARGEVITLTGYADTRPVEMPEADFADYEVVEDFENEKIEAALLERATMIEDVKITFYCCEKRKHICGTGDGLTASGTEVTPYVTVAVDPKVIPLGSEVMVDFGDGEIHYFIADDTGGGVKGNHIDIAVVSHEEALELGIKTATVYWIGGEDNA